MCEYVEKILYFFLRPLRRILCVPFVDVVLLNGITIALADFRSNLERL